MNYDIVIIGAGTAGITAAKEAAANGLKTLLVARDEDSVGGVCLNNGCVPTKFLLRNVKNYAWQNLLENKNALIKQLRDPIIPFLKKSGVDIVFGEGLLTSADTVKVNKTFYLTKSIVIAVGSSPIKVFDSEKVIVSENFLNQKNIGKNVLIVGGGYIGVEFACLLNSAGHNVTIYEQEAVILSGFSDILTTRLVAQLVRAGIKIVTSRAANELDFENFDTVITAVGRKANIDGLGLINLGLTVDNGWIKTDKFLRTNISNIYACGDVTGKKMLAYIADYQAKLCVANILKRNETENFKGIPDCVFATPQMAVVGMTEEEAKEKGIHEKTHKMPFARFSSAYVYDDTRGFAYIVEGSGGIVLGGGVLSNNAVELISIIAMAVRAGQTVNDIKNNIFVHPSLAEIIPKIIN